MYSLTNNVLTVQIAEKGAELQSIFHEQNGLEYMWNADPAYWGKKSPVLFPVVGELKNKKYVFEGNEYTLGRHGFAREMMFAITGQTKTSVTFSIESSKETLAVYPFEFIFSVKYSLNENKVEVTYKVENKDNREMYFSVGGHPAFKVPLMHATAFEDYKLLFQQKENAGIYRLSAEGLIEREAVPFLSNDNEVALVKSLFAKDALVFKELQSEEVSIVSDKTIHGVKVNFEGFPYLGIWSTKGADFVCIEPWCGIADTVDNTGRLNEKEGIQQLAAQQSFERCFSIEVF